MKVTYIEKGREFNFKRIDAEKTFFALSYWKAEGTSLLYFKVNQFEIKSIPENDIIKIEK